MCSLDELTEELVSKVLPHSQSRQALLRASGLGWVLPWDRLK